MVDYRMYCESGEEGKKEWALVCETIEDYVNLNERMEKSEDKRAKMFCKYLSKRLLPEILPVMQGKIDEERKELERVEKEKQKEWNKMRALAEIDTLKRSDRLRRKRVVYTDEVSSGSSESVKKIREEYIVRTRAERYSKRGDVYEQESYEVNDDSGMGSNEVIESEIASIEVTETVSNEMGSNEVDSYERKAEEND
jgi:hypothetical protein